MTAKERMRADRVENIRRSLDHPPERIGPNIRTKGIGLYLGSATARGPDSCTAAEPEGSLKLIGILLIVFGVIALAAGGLSYTKRDKIIDLGPIQATTEHQKTIPLSPIVGIAAVAGGVVLVVAGARTRV